ncbi:MAG: hypothetical protein CTY39_04870 [Hyphomicrobium sp.]|nr:MAG: hypothetical protein CTY39_04870 [Hyphomicrobium sp.]
MNNIEKEQVYDSSKRNPLSLMIRSEFISEARSLRLNTLSAAEVGVELEVKKVKEAAWLSENKPAIDVYNKRINQSGTFLKPIWLAD